MISKLDTYSSELTTKIRGLDTMQRQAVRILACAYALRATAIQSPLLDGALKQINRGQTLDQTTTLQLAEMQTVWDIEALRWHDENPDQSIEFSKSYSKARAVAAILAAEDADCVSATINTVYEACRAIPDEQQLVSRLMAILKT